MDRWRHGYVVNLRETQRTSKSNIDSLKINVNDIVLVFYKKMPRHFWKISVVTRVLPSRDSEIRGAIVKIAKTNTIFKPPVSKLFAFENIYHDTNQTDKASHKVIAFPSPAVLWIVNIHERKPRYKNSEFYFTTSKNRLSEYDGWRAS